MPLCRRSHTISFSVFGAASTSQKPKKIYDLGVRLSRKNFTTDHRFNQIPPNFHLKKKNFRSKLENRNDLRRKKDEATWGNETLTLRTRVGHYFRDYLAILAVECWTFCRDLSWPRFVNRVAVGAGESFALNTTKIGGAPTSRIEI